MFQSKDENFNRVKEFHGKMDGRTQETVRLFPADETLHRADFKLEEVVEFLHASAENQEVFQSMIEDLHTALDKAVAKVNQKGPASVSLVGQADALVDLLYFTYGSFALIGVDPAPLFDLVHEANMGKIFPDGKAHFDPLTHKILKPDDWEEKYAPEPALKQALEKQLERKNQTWEAQVWFVLLETFFFIANDEEVDCGMAEDIFRRRANQEAFKGIEPCGS